MEEYSEEKDTVVPLAVGPVVEKTVLKDQVEPKIAVPKLNILKLEYVEDK